VTRAREIRDADACCQELSAGGSGGETARQGEKSCGEREQQREMDRLWYNTMRERGVVRRLTYPKILLQISNSDPSASDGNPMNMFLEDKLNCDCPLYCSSGKKM